MSLKIEIYDRTIPEHKPQPPLTRHAPPSPTSRLYIWFPNKSTNCPSLMDTHLIQLLFILPPQSFTHFKYAHVCSVRTNILDFGTGFVDSLFLWLLSACKHRWWCNGCRPLWSRCSTNRTTNSATNHKQTSHNIKSTNWWTTVGSDCEVTLTNNHFPHSSVTWACHQFTAFPSLEHFW